MLLILDVIKIILIASLCKQELLETNRRAAKEVLDCEKLKSKRVQEDNDRYKEREELLREETSNLHMQIDKLTETNHELRDRMLEYQASERRERTKIEDLNSEVCGKTKQICRQISLVFSVLWLLWNKLFIKAVITDHHLLGENHLQFLCTELILKLMVSRLHLYKSW